MISKRIIFLLLLSVSLGAFLFNESCKHDPQGIDQFDPICFETQILPIIQTSCGIASCHDGGAESEGGFNATSYSNIVRAVDPGNAAKSELYKAITTVNGEGMMPPTRPLSKDQRTLILVWIQQGAKNTTCP